MRIIALYSPKGGVGKTAAAVNVAYLASKDNCQTLLWDLDPQGASSFYLSGAEPLKGNQLKKLLAPLSKETSLVIVDCPPTLSRLTEQALAVADQVYVPLVPTWLSMNSWSQLHDFAKIKKLGVKKLRPFFSMVDRRKKLHQELVKRGPELTANCLDVAIPYASVVERMGEEGQPQYSRLNPAPRSLPWLLTK
jgi:chromosome partitioning protein